MPAPTTGPVMIAACANLNLPARIVTSVPIIGPVVSAMFALRNLVVVIAIAALDTIQANVAQPVSTTGLATNATFVRLILLVRTAMLARTFGRATIAVFAHRNLKASIAMSAPKTLVDQTVMRCEM